MIISNSSKKLTLIYTQKAACSIALKTFLDYIGFKYDRTKWIHNEVKKYGHCPHNSAFTLFQVVRNPYTRAVSSYLHALRFDLGNARRKHLSFYQFLKTLHRRINLIYNGHCSIQFQKEVPHILKIETIESDINFFFQKTGINLILNKNIDCIGANTKPYHHHVIHSVQNENAEPQFRGKNFYFELIDCLTALNRVNVITPEVAETPSPINSYADFYDEEIKNMVTNLYKKDIEYFGYDFPFKKDQK